MKAALPLLVLFIFGFAPHVQAIVNGHEYVFDDNSKADIFQELANELRCPKCQNQNLADSNAMIADDLRRELYQQVKSGKSSDEIVDFMVDRYGEFVLYKPKVNAMTFVLWYGPAILCFLAVGVFVLVVWQRRRRSAGVTPVKSHQQETRSSNEQDGFSAEEKAKLDALLDEDNADNNKGN